MLGYATRNKFRTVVQGHFVVFPFVETDDAYSISVELAPVLIQLFCFVLWNGWLRHPMDDRSLHARHVPNDVFSEIVNDVI